MGWKRQTAATIEKTNIVAIHSQIGFIIMRNKRAERICELSGNSRQHLSILDKLKDKPTSGEPSLQNALELAFSTLKVWSIL